MKTINSGLDGLNADGLVAKSTVVTTMMTANTTYPTPNPTLVAVLAATVTLKHAITAAAEGGKGAFQAKRDATAVLRGLLMQLCAYVENVANGDAQKILSAGFEPRRKPTPTGLLPAPLGLQAFNSGKAGTVSLRWKPLRGAHSYQVYMTATPNDEKSWVAVHATTKARDIVEGLESGKLCYFRVAGIGAAGEGLVSEPADSRAA